MNRSPDLTDAMLGPYQIEVLIGQGGMGYGAISRDGRMMLVTRGGQARDAFLITNFR